MAEHPLSVVKRQPPRAVGDGRRRPTPRVGHAVSPREEIVRQIKWLKVCLRNMQTGESWPLTPEDQEDVIQEALAKALSHVGDYDPERAGIRSWLRSILRNTACDYARSRAERRSVTLDEAQEHKGREIDPAKKVARDLDVHTLLTAIRAHCDRKETLVYHAIVLWVWEGETLCNAAARVGLSSRKVYTHVAKVLAAVKKQFKQAVD